MRAKRLAGMLILLASFAGLAALLAPSWEQLAELDFRWEAGKLALSGLLFCAQHSLGALLWRAFLALAGVEEPARSAMRSWFTSQLGKYTPGNVGAIALRIGTALEARASQVALAMAYEGLVHTAWALLFGLHLLSWLYLPQAGVLTGAILAGLGLAFALRSWLLRLLDGVLRKLGRPRLGATPLRLPTILVLGLGVPLHWLLVGAVFLLFASGLGLELPPDLGLAAPAVAWAGGFLVLAAPGGLGVRELLLVFLLGPALGTGTATALSLAYRVWITLLDVLVSGSGALLLGRPERRSRKRSREEGPSAAGGAPSED